MAKRTPRTITADADEAGGRTTYHADDGYLAWQDTVCLGSVTGPSEGRVVCSDYRIARRRYVTDQQYTIEYHPGAGDFVVTFCDGRAPLRGAQSYVEAETAALKAVQG